MSLDVPNYTQSDPVEFLEAVTAELRNRGDVKVAGAMRRRMQVAEYDSPYGADDRPRLKVVEDTDPEKLDFAKNVYLTSPTKAGGSGLAGFGVSDLFRGIDQHIDQTISKARKDGLSVVDVVESTTSWDDLAGEADQDWCQGRYPCTIRDLPDGGGRDIEGIVRGHAREDTATQATRSNIRVTEAKCEGCCQGRTVGR